MDWHRPGCSCAPGDESLLVESPGIAQRTCGRRRRRGHAGNTRSVCRKCYIHPAVIDAYMDRTLAHTLSVRAGERLASAGLSRMETAVLALLQRRLRRDAQRKSA